MSFIKREEYMAQNPLQRLTSLVKTLKILS